MVKEYQDPRTSQVKNQYIFENAPEQAIAFIKNAAGQLTESQRQHFNRQLIYNNYFVELYAEQSTYADKVGCSRKTINRSNKKLHELGLHHSTFRGVKKTCLVHINAWFNNLDIRNRLSHIFPALKAFPTAVLLSGYLATIDVNGNKRLFNEGNVPQRLYIYNYSLAACKKTCDWREACRLSGSRETRGYRETNRLYSPSVVPRMGTRSKDMFYEGNQFPNSCLNFKNSQKREQASLSMGYHVMSLMKEKETAMKQRYGRSEAFQSMGNLLGSGGGNQRTIEPYTGTVPEAFDENPEMVIIRKDYEDGKRMLGYITQFNSTLSPDRMAKYEEIKQRVTELENILKTGIITERAPQSSEQINQEKLQLETKLPDLPEAIELLARVPEDNPLRKPLIKQFTKLWRLRKSIKNNHDVNKYLSIDREVRRMMNHLFYL